MNELISICEDAVRTNKRFLVFWYIFLVSIIALFIWSLSIRTWFALLNAANIIYIIWQINVTQHRRDEWQIKANNYKEL